MSETIRIQDRHSLTEASIHVSRGSNCYSFRIPHAGRLIEVLWSAPDFVSGAARPSSSGIPILFPFPGRIQNGHLDWNGDQYSLDKGDRLGNAIHGFVFDRPWRIINQTENRLETQFQASVDDGSIRSKWPSDFQISARFEVSAYQLEIVFDVLNPSDNRLPFGLGLHPYFRLPILENSRADDYLIKMPLIQRWELANMNPTGKQEDLDSPELFLLGQRFGDILFDDVFSNAENGMRHEFEIVDPKETVRLLLRCDLELPYTVVFTPPHREAICIEPYSCIPDAFRLAGTGIDAGLRVLAPQESFSTRISIEVQTD